MSEPSTTRRLWQGGLLGPVVLIALGVLLLLNNFGAVSWEVWAWLWQFWPVLLVLLGLELLLTGRASWGAVLFAIIVLFIGSTVAAGPLAWFGQARPDAETVAPSTSFSQPLEGATAATVSIDYGAGQLIVSGGAGPANLAEGEWRSTAARLSRHYEVRDGLGSLALSLDRSDGPRLLFNGAATSLELRLSPAVQLQRLAIRTGAADAQLDLTSLRLQHLDVQAGASHMVLHLPAQGQVSAIVRAGASHLELRVPLDVAARIRVESGLSGVAVDEQRFPPAGESEGFPGLVSRREYRSPDFDQAANRVDLTISSGAASVDVR